MAETPARFTPGRVGQIGDFTHLACPLEVEGAGWVNLSPQNPLGLLQTFDQFFEHLLIHKSSSLLLVITQSSVSLDPKILRDGMAKDAYLLRYLPASAKPPIKSFELTIPEIPSLIYYPWLPWCGDWVHKADTHSNMRVLIGSLDRIYSFFRFHLMILIYTKKNGTIFLLMSLIFLPSWSEI
jgi:hypothetical protein